MPLFRAIDWRRSPAHLLFLSQFRSERTAEQYSRSDDWRNALGENPRKAAKRFLDAGLLRDCGLAGALAYRCKVADLKEVLRARGLAVSGRKDELVQRLIGADPATAKRLAAGTTVLRCSDAGEQVVSEYLEHEKAKRAQAEERTLAALRAHHFEEASRAVAAFEAEQVFPRGIGIDWKNFDTSGDVTLLRTIFSGKPSALAALPKDSWEPLRIAAAMRYLCGGREQLWVSPPFDSGPRLENHDAQNLLLTYAYAQRSLAELRSAGFTAVRVSTCNDDQVCPECRRLAGRKYPLGNVPELPYERCTSRTGCRCHILGTDY